MSPKKGYLFIYFAVAILKHFRLSLLPTTSFISFPVASGPCLHVLPTSLTRYSGKAPPTSSPHNQFFSPLFGYLLVSFLFSLVSFPSCHSADNDTHQRLQQRKPLLRLHQIEHLRWLEELMRN